MHTHIYRSNHFSFKAKPKLLPFPPFPPFLCLSCCPSGDNDPFDVIDISRLTAGVGDVFPVKIIAAIPAVDSGELDWKYVAINTADTLAPSVSTLDDVAKYFPAEFAAIRTKYFWGGSVDGAVSAADAITHLRGAHAAWAALAEDCVGTVSASQSAKRAHDTAKERRRMAIDPYVEC